MKTNSRAPRRVHGGDVHPLHRRADPVPHGVVRVLQPQPALVGLLRAALRALPLRECQSCILELYGVGGC